MYEHSCRNAGAVGCGYRVTAGSPEELRAKVTEHARKVHNVPVMTDTIYNFLRGRAERA